jgi:hypothetical protein
MKNALATIGQAAAFFAFHAVLTVGGTIAWLSDPQPIIGYLLLVLWPLFILGMLTLALRLAWWLLRHTLIRPVTRVVIQTIAEERNR